MFIYMMKPQVGCTIVHLVRGKKSIKTIMIPRTSYQTSTNKTKPRDASYRVIPGNRNHGF